ncbi:MAG: helix-turn-helix domain-containing protein [Gemmatimonadales bacterium]
MPPIPVDSYVLDTLLPDLVGHDRQPSAILVYLYLWRHAHGASHFEVQVSLQEMTLGTGLSKRAVQSALSLLARRRLLSVARANITAVPRYTVRRPWLRGAGG